MMIEAYPTELADLMPAFNFQCGDAPECHADDHVNCTDMSVAFAHGAFPDECMATCGQCGHEFIALEPEILEQIRNATPEQCAEWHDEAQL